MASAWGGWGTKLNVTSIVSQGLEQVRSLREDVEKSFDQVVTGAPGARLPLPQAVPVISSGEQDDDKVTAIEADDTPIEAEDPLLEDTANSSEAPEEETEITEEPKGEATTETLQEEQKEDAQVVQTESKQEEEDDADVLVKLGEAEDKQEKPIEDQTEEEEDTEAEVEVEEKIPKVVQKVEEAEAGEDQEGGKEGEKEEEEEEEEEVFVGEDVADDVAALRKKLEVRESQLLATSATIQELHDELDKTCHREVAAVERVQFLTEQLENMRREVAKLTQLHRDTSKSQSADVQTLQMALAEKEEKLSALLDEGQALSVKQAQLEVRLRTLRKEKDELEERALKLQSQWESSTEEVKDLSAKLKASEEDKTRLAQENRQLMSSADATNGKVEKAERQAQEATQQLEKVQTQVEQLALEVSSKNEEIERLKVATQSNEALSVEKEELHHTIQFLQDNVRDLEEEAARREEMARAEVADLKRKWQDAVARVDMLGQSVSEATQPLLRQIHSLQEEQRTRQESWKATEAALLAQIEEATEQRRAVEQEKLLMEQEVQELRRKVEESELEATRKQAELARAQEEAERAKAEAGELRGQADALQIDLNQARHQRDAETEAKQQLQTRLDNAERSSKQQEASATATVELKQAREREAQLRQDLEWHQQEVQRLKSSTSLSAPAPLSTGSTSSQHYVRPSVDGEQYNGAEGALSSEASILKTTLETTMEDPLSSNGNTSVLGLSQLQQRLRLREGENRMLKQQLEALEARQKQTTDEIVRLSTRNALLESGEAQREQTQLELAKLQKHQVVLLELFGEKEEQVEELQAEVSELKAFYRKQLDTLASHNEEQQKQREEQQH
ncbi:TATA element modulatory factor 1 TATA binding [Phytophthora infestans]|uniref:TATA element modulatory factor 1 TATA binding n=1 Tax=Phytophthora infestans TaxID=4787 RepID=A0A833SQ73_PHYIN|nr:TATA element modulatory factor 1 TATA binding [Phytophthora infestans]